MGYNAVVQPISSQIVVAVIVILQHIVAKIGAIYFTEGMARYASRRGFELKWEGSHRQSWLVQGIHA
jgi:hypothetical protein